MPEFKMSPKNLSTSQKTTAESWRMRARELIPLKIGRCKIVRFPKIMDARGNLSFIEGRSQIPFEIKRVYYVYDIPSGAKRGGHAHRQMEAIIIALSGSFEVKVDDGFKIDSIFLNKPNYGLYLPAEIWREIDNFSSNSIALVLASTLYNECDYIRDYALFKKIARTKTEKC